jgi:broad specificity phosphatase PhoE
MSDPVTEKYIYFVRHGQSEANLDPVFQGPDEPLTQHGIEQATFVADRLRTIKAEVIITSPMPRARETAAIIHKATQIPFEVNKLFREYRPPSTLAGKHKDLPEGQIFLRQQREHFADQLWHYSDEDNYHDLHTRAIEVLAHLIERPEHCMIVVSHAGFARVIMTAMITEGSPDPLLAQRLTRFLKPQNTGISLVRYRSDATRRSKWRLLTWNDYAHLADTHLAEPTVQDTWEDEPSEI